MRLILQRVESAAVVVAADEGWMPQSEEHASVLDVLGVSHGVVALTRTDLVDEETLPGVRWIVDYKTGTHGGGSLHEFLDREQERYGEQLERYAALVSALDPRPVRLALYFPAMGGWREWPAGRAG